MANKNLDMPEILEEGAQAGFNLAQALEKARAAAKALASTSTQVKRVLAGFDQINRLGEKKKTTSGKKKTSEKNQQTQESLQQVQTQAQSIRQILDGLDQVVLDSLILKAPGLTNAISTLCQAGQTLWNSWQGQMVPVGQWFNETLIPLVGQHLGENVQRAMQLVAVAGTQISNCWRALGESAGDAVWRIGQCFMGISGEMDAVVLKIFGGSQQIGSSTETMTQQITNATGNALTGLTTLQDGWNTVLGNMQGGIAGMVSGTVGALQNVTGYLQGDFHQAWQAGFDGLKTPAKGAFNGVIGFMNKLIDGMGSTCNSMVGIINKLKIKVPDWVPGIGGKEYSFSLKTVTTPEIPYLAKGAVLPANQPFLAVVGDQKHGTNVEAPLSTIQEAVAAVMADHTAGNMAGHEATVAVLNRILEAVLGIDVGEAVIARSVQSYRTKQAVMKGGGF